VRIPPQSQVGIPPRDDGKRSNRGYARHVKTDSPRRRLAIDLALCAVLLAFGVRITGLADDGTPIDWLMFPPIVLPVLLRRRAPFAAAAAFAAGCVVSALPVFNQFRLPVAIPVALLIVYPLGRDSERRRALGGLGLVLAAWVLIGLTDPALDGEGGVVSMVAFAFPLYTGIWAGGRLVRSGDRVAGQLAERSRRLERQREQTAELAVEVERTQLASELDTAARDRVRVMVELAEAGERSPEDASAAFGRIERLGRESLNEMRGLLGVLRSDERGTRAPRPTLAQLENLLADARKGGRLVDVEVEGERRPLPGSLELAAYRVLQHALVAVRGGDDDPATIELHYLPGALELEVRGLSTDGSGAEAALLAARERVASHGGSFVAESSTAGRRVLRARLPTEATHV
jgi:signal transduction histidine kinase